MTAIVLWKKSGIRRQETKSCFQLWPPQTGSLASPWPSPQPQLPHWVRLVISKAPALKACNFKSFLHLERMEGTAPVLFMLWRLMELCRVISANVLAFCAGCVGSILITMTINKQRHSVSPMK